MAKKLFLTGILLLAITIGVKAQSKDETAVANAAEQLRKAMVDADPVMLDKLTSTLLTYGHSGGHIQGKAEFIQDIVSGKSDFVTLEISEQSVVISKDLAIVRHKFNAVTNDSGKPGEAHLLVLQIWQKQHGDWKLTARQAVKNQ